MKSVVLAALMLLSTQVFAANPTCNVTWTSGKQSNPMSIELMPYQHPNADDLIAYVFDGTIGDFALHITKVDGTFFSHVQIGDVQVNNSFGNSLNYSVENKAQGLSIHCD